MTEKSDKILLSISVAFVAVGFYLFNSIVPYYSDDWWYAFIHEEDRSYPTRYITSLHDVFISQINHYHTVNGRLPVTALVQIVVTFCPKWLFDIINTVIFTTASFLIVRYISPARISAKRFCAVAASIFFLLPGHYETMMWATGAINYLWVATFILATMLMWRRLCQKDVNPICYPLIFVIGILAGWSNEALSFGLAAGFLVELYCKGKQTTIGQWILAAGFVIGAAMILIAPGSWNRLGDNSMSNNINLYLPILGAMVLPLTLALALYHQYKTNKQQACLFVVQYRMWLIASMVLIPICLITYQYATRSFFGMAFFSLIPLLAWVDRQYTQSKILSKRIERVIFISIIVFTAVLYTEHYKNETSHRTIIDYYTHSDNGVIAYDLPQRAWYAQPYTLNIDNEYRKGWSARHMAAYYQHAPLQWLSTSLYKALSQPQDLFVDEHKVAGDNQLYTTADLDVYILHPASDKPASLLYSYTPVSFQDDVPLPSKIMRLITPDKYPLSEILPAYYVNIDLGSQGQFHGIKKNSYRNVTAINHLQKR